MNPRISIPRQYSGPGLPSMASSTSTASMTSTLNARRSSSFKVQASRFFRRLLKFPQMDFEMAIWEMTTLLVAPKKVFKSITPSTETKNTWHRHDPSFAYLLSFFLLLTALAWGLAYTPSFTSILKLAASFVLLHFLGSSLLIATITYVAVPRLFGPEGWLARRGLGGLGIGRGRMGYGRRRAQGLFGDAGLRGGMSGLSALGGENIEFGYCFDVSNRAFFPLYIHLYVLQFILLPLLTRTKQVPSSAPAPADGAAQQAAPTQTHPTTLALLLSDTLYLSAFIYYIYITFLGYNILPSLRHTEALLLPIVVSFVLYLVALIMGWSITEQGGAVSALFWGVKS
ncbi:hypothetical protein KEM55_008009 [Ascosphaera atra]|nr:hypothetical protein KEM55_008009 [Ascosphaera atra]